MGVAAAKAYALALGVPLYGVNHLAAHVAVDVLEHGPLPEPCIALLVSGGHSSLLLVDDLTRDLTPLGQTVDDAAGEAFDKVARLLGLGFPGGPVVDRLAREGDPAAIAFPRSMSRDASYDVSFSGLKTAVARWVEAHEGEVPVADVCASFQEAVVDVLTAKAVRACREQGVDTLLIGGGVAANTGCARSRRSAATPRACGCGCRGPGCAPTTAPWWPRSAPGCWRPGATPSPLDLPADSAMPRHRVVVPVRNGLARSDHRVGQYGRRTLDCPGAPPARDPSDRSCRHDAPDRTPPAAAPALSGVKWD